VDRSDERKTEKDEGCREKENVDAQSKKDQATANPA
jgi:hypothetical protein